MHEGPSESCRQVLATHDSAVAAGRVIRVGNDEGDVLAVDVDKTAVWASKFDTMLFRSDALVKDARFDVVVICREVQEVRTVVAEVRAAVAGIVADKSVEKVALGVVLVG